MPATQDDAAALVTLQRVILPEHGICTEPDLYLRLPLGGGMRPAAGEVLLPVGARVGFDTYFNALSLGKWQAHCALDGLFLGLSGAGTAELRVWQAPPDRSWDIVHCDTITLAGAETLVDLSAVLEAGTGGVVFFELRALGGDPLLRLDGARFATRAAPAAWPSLAICITTFRREAAVRATAARLEDFLAGYAFGDRIRVIVVDNGASAAVPATAHVRQVENPNLGGAGGFARGLAEAEAAGATHCLFMDDDASFHMENIARTYAFLALARDSRAAVAGAMINNTHKWAMWENGAVFDRACRPQFCGADLRETAEVIRIEHESAREGRPNFYGGWWFFAFPVAHVERRPFPFFVRGDDVSFSLANRFRIVTLNGVVSFQDDFTEKESPQTLYLDLRSHLVHHLVFDAIDRGAWGTARVALRFILRSLVRFHYETAEAQLLAWHDVMRGPAFFADNADMAERRQAIRALVATEAWQPLDTLRPAGRTGTRWPKWLHRVFAFSLNGHLLPFFGFWGDRVTLTVGERGLLYPAWGAAEITYLSGDRSKGYTVRQSKRRFLGVGLRVATTTLRFVAAFGGLRAAYRGAYPEMASARFWQARFGPAAAEASGQPAPAKA
jgi:GT2 family glycosyltransferase